MTRTTLFLKITDERGESSADAWSLEERRNKKKKKKQRENDERFGNSKSNFTSSWQSSTDNALPAGERGSIEINKKRIARMC